MSTLTDIVSKIATTGTGTGGSTGTETGNSISFGERYFKSSDQLLQWQNEAMRMLNRAVVTTKPMKMNTSLVK